MCNNLLLYTMLLVLDVAVQFLLALGEEVTILTLKHLPIRVCDQVSAHDVITAGSEVTRVTLVYFLHLVLHFLV